MVQVQFSSWCYWPGEVKEYWGAEKIPFLVLLDGESEDALKGQKEDGDGQVPVVKVVF